MGRYLTITNSNVNRLGYKKRALDRSVRVGPIALKFIALGLGFILLLFYIIQSNESSLKGYKIQELEDQKQDLINETQKLNLEAARLKSLEALEATNQLNLAPPVKTDYIPTSGPVAVKDR